MVAAMKFLSGAGNVEDERRRRLAINFHLEEGTAVLVLFVLLVLVAGVVIAYVQVRFSPLFALVPVVAIPLGLVIVSHPDWGLMAVLFTIPLEDFYRVGGLPPSFSIIKLLSVGVFGAFLVYFIAFRRHEQLVSAQQNLVISAFVAAILASYFYSIDPPTTLRKALVILRMVSLYVLVINLVRTERDLRTMVWVLVVSGFICAAYGVYTYYFLPSDLKGGRISGTMGDPNEFAGAMVARLPFIVYLWPWSSTRRALTFLSLALVVTLYAIVLSGSRGGFLALALTTLIMVAMQRKRRLLSVMVVILAGLLLIAVMPYHIKTRLGLTGEEDRGAKSSQEHRRIFQQFGLRLFLRHPVIGIGFGGFGEAYERSEYRFLGRSPTSSKWVAHNMYLEIAVGLGLVGMIPFLYLLFITLKDAYVAARAGAAGGFTADMGRALVAGFAGFLLASVFLSEQFEKTLWVMIAMGVVIARLSQDRARVELGQL